MTTITTVQNNLAEAMDVTTPYLPEALIGGETVAALRQLAARLPLVTTAGFECRLQADDPAVDFQFRVSEPEAAHFLPETAGNNGNAMLAQPGWERFARFCRAWRQPDSLLHDHIAATGLELDTGAAGGDCPPPSPFLALREAGAQVFGIGYDSTATLAHRKLFYLLADLFWDGAPPPFITEQLLRFLIALPPTAALPSIGFMLGRQGDGLRINVRGVRPAELIAYLERVGWPGAIDEATALLTALRPCAAFVDLAFDVTQNGVLPRLGFECFVGERAEFAEKWPLLSAHLADRRLCTPAKREALSAWPGFVRPSESQSWPGSLTAAAALLDGRQASVYKRFLSHIKVTYQPDRPLTAKGYLGFSHHWV